MTTRIRNTTEDAPIAKMVVLMGGGAGIYAQEAAGQRERRRSPRGGKSWGMWTMPEPLLPCPICGHPPGDGQANSGSYWRYCVRLGHDLETPWMTSREAAITAWNEIVARLLAPDGAVSDG